MTPYLIWILTYVSLLTGGHLSYTMGDIIYNQTENNSAFPERLNKTVTLRFLCSLNLTGTDEAVIPTKAIDTSTHPNPSIIYGRTTTPESSPTKISPPASETDLTAVSYTPSSEATHTATKKYPSPSSSWVATATGPFITTPDHQDLDKVTVINETSEHPTSTMVTSARFEETQTQTTSQDSSDQLSVHQQPSWLFLLILCAVATVALAIVFIASVLVRFWRRGRSLGSFFYRGFWSPARAQNNPERGTYHTV